VANAEHLTQLKKGVENWNEWRIANSGVRPVLSDACLSGTDLSGADLSDADLSDAYLNGADLRDADLSDANFSNADLSGADLSGADLNGANFSSVNLSNANLNGVNLSEADLREVDLMYANLSTANLRRANLSSTNLSGANLSGANLSNAGLNGANLRRANLSSVNLSRADLSDAGLNGANLSSVNLSRADLRNADLNGANLSGANLSNALLSASQFLGSNLTAATLTGACIQDWNINSATQLDDVICEYVYLKYGWSNREHKYLLSDRRPSDPDRIFAPGEFSKLFQKALETVDLIFGDGIDWKAFFQSFQELRSQYDDDDLSIQAIEKKSGGAFVIRLEVPAEADKGAIESRAKELYERELQLQEAHYTALLQAKDGQIMTYQVCLDSIRQSNTDLTGIIKTMAEQQPTNVTQNFNASVTGVAGNVAGDQNIYAAPEKQSLAEAAAEIQKLLKQLEQTNPTATEAEQKAFVTAAIPATLRQRAAGALQAGGKTAIAEFLENPYVNVAIAIVEGWRDAGT